MKRYHVFAGDTYYPGGGSADYVGSYETLEEAEQVANRERKRQYDWSEIMMTLPDGSLAGLHTPESAEVK